MPDPFSFNPWGINPWAAEPARDAAQAPSLRDFLPPVEPLVIPPPPPPPTGPRTEFTYSGEDWFQSLTRHWPEHGPVIPPEQHVNLGMAGAVREFVNQHVKAGDPWRDILQCFDYAAYQLRVANFRTGGRPSKDTRSLQILTEYANNGKLVEEVQVEAAVEAVMYIKEALLQDIPVLIGLCIRELKKDGRPFRPNNVGSTAFIEPTNHYVVIVGMGKSDRGAAYFQYYDYYFHPLSENGQACRFYLNANMKLESGGKAMVVAEVRRTMPR